MDWALEFYQKQNLWSGCYDGEVREEHREKAAFVDKSVGSSAKRVLELGAGGGQVSVALAQMGHDVVAVDLVSSALIA